MVSIKTLDRYLTGQRGGISILYTNPIAGAGFWYEPDIIPLVQSV